MISQNNSNENQLDEFDTAPSLYTKKAVFLFSVFVTPLFGGVMLFQNLRRLGKNREAGIAMSLSLIITIAISFTINVLNGMSTGIFLNVAGGGLLTEFVFRKYIPDQSFPKRSVTTPLIIAIALVAILVAANISTLQP